MTYSPLVGTHFKSHVYKQKEYLNTIFSYSLQELQNLAKEKNLTASFFVSNDEGDYDYISNINIYSDTDIVYPSYNQAVLTTAGLWIYGNFATKQDLILAFKNSYFCKENPLVFDMLLGNKPVTKSGKNREAYEIFIKLHTGYVANPEK